MKIKVGVIFGGKSVEHEVSVISAIQAINNMDTERYEIVPIYISKNKEWYTGKDLLKIENYKNIDELITKCIPVCLCTINNEFCLISTRKKIQKIVAKLDIAFPIVHGKNVEDGTLVGLLETVGIPYVGSEVIGAALGQDKVILKQILKDNNIPVTDYIWFYDYEYLQNNNQIKKQIKALGYPVVVKPACLGSSVGIKFIENETQIEEAIEDAIEYDRKIVVEKAVENLVELNCSVLGDYMNQETSEIEEVSGEHEILTYEDKYIGNKKQKSSKGMVNTDRIIPARIDRKVADEVSNLSKQTFRALNLTGICRVDFLLDSKNNKIYVNEPNVIPGSLSFYLWEPIGVKYKDLLTKLIDIGMNNYKNQMKKVNSFDTNILNNFNQNSGLKSKKM